MELKRIIVGGLENNCYILKSGTTGIIVDPGDEAQKILNAVGDLKIMLILATHRHFDHITALQQVKKALETRAAIHRLDWVSGFDEELEDGQVIEFGRDTLKVLHTPGHTPGGCCFLVNDVLISGDTLFPNGPGNTAFPGGDEKAILKSIREKLLVLSDETVVYPGHGPKTTIGKERSLY
ncbi:MAG: MBL fold metallo-hydrolase [candidate division WOR-3 bacterium]|nr:MAG: MBL fold metallo-hydrolase [candidate division WOR-3 bacterium]